MLEDREIIIEIDDPNLASIKTGSSVLITRVEGIVDVVEELTIDYVPGMRVGVIGTEREAMPPCRPHRCLKTVVVGIAFVFDQVNAGEADILPMVVGIGAGGAAASAAAYVDTVRSISQRQCVDVDGLRQVIGRVAHISQSRHNIASQLMFDAKAELIHRRNRQ